MENERCKSRARRSARGEEEEVPGVESEVDLSIIKEVARWCLLCLPRCRKGKGVSPQIRLVRGLTSPHLHISPYCYSYRYNNCCCYYYILRPWMIPG